MTPRSDLLKNSSVRLMTSGFEGQAVEYFRKCPKCGSYMNPHLKYVYGVAFTGYSCWCGYSEDTFGVRYDNKTTYTGGGASGRTTYRENR